MLLYHRPYLAHKHYLTVLGTVSAQSRKMILSDELFIFIEINILTDRYRWYMGDCREDKAIIFFISQTSVLI